MALPELGTAVPKRRYQIGSDMAVLLGDIESKGDVHYRYVLALLRAGQPEPTFYVTAERGAKEPAGVPLDLCIYTAEGGREQIDASKEWRKIDHFADRALELAIARHGLNAQPQRLM